MVYQVFFYKTKELHKEEVSMPKDLRSFLKQLEDANEIIRIKKPVDPTVNLGGLAWQGENKLGKATYFENLVGYEGWNDVGHLLDISNGSG
jgi:UbiD family decarboxylase